MTRDQNQCCHTPLCLYCPLRIRKLFPRQILDKGIMNHSNKFRTIPILIGMKVCLRNRIA